MTPTEQARRSDALYYGNVSRRALCDMVARLEAKGKSVNIKTKLAPMAYLPERAHDTDAGADIRTPEAFTLKAHGSEIVATGVHVQLPEKTVGMLKSKSGLNVKHGIISEGVIDEGFSGEIMVKLYNLSDHDYRFERGDKITQLVVLPVCYHRFAQADEIRGGERGTDGFGSTGK